MMSELSAETEGESASVTERVGCGFGRCQLQTFANPKWFMVVLCTYCFMEAFIASGLTSVVLSPLETRYEFSSTQLGMMTSTFDITLVVIVVPISYFGGKCHKPKWLGGGMFIMGLGSLVFALPQFIIGEYNAGKTTNLNFEACNDVNDFSPDCKKVSSNKNAYSMFIIANILIGIGAAPLFTIGTSYIDDIFRPKYTPICLGIFYTVAVIASGVGYLLGGAFLKVYVDFWKDTTLMEAEPEWVGAWWLGFVLCGFVSMLISILFFMFPEKYPDSDAIQEERARLVSIQHKKPLKNDNLCQVIKELPKQLKDLLFHMPFLFVTITSFLQALMSGITAFGPKYIEVQFGVTSSVSSLVSGAVAIPSNMVGIMLGALLGFCTKPTKRSRLPLYLFFLNAVTTVSLFGFFLRCSTHDIAGITVSYPNSTLFDEQTLNTTCNSDCECLSTVFEPVCSDGITYFSPCRAGCDKYFLDGNTDSPQFENCTCGLSAIAEEGYCDNDCKVLAPFVIMIGVVLMMNMATLIPILLITLRCSGDEQKTLALGLQSLFVRAFGSIPGPIIVGALLDASCIYWQEECGDRGNCWIYDNKDLSLGMFGFTIGVRILSVIFAFCTWKFYDVTLCNRGKVTMTYEGIGEK